MLNMIKYKIKLSSVTVCALFVLVVSYMPQLHAQELVLPSPTEAVDKAVDETLVEDSVDDESVDVEESKKKVHKKITLPKGVRSLFFTYWQHQAITDAKNSIGSVRAPTQSELDAMDSGDDVEKEPGLRELSLGGILFRDESDWVIYLNEQRVKPDAMPKEVFDLKVYNEYVEFKWLDEYTNQIFPIRLRSHQRFNLDSRIFLPN